MKRIGLFCFLGIAVCLMIFHQPLLTRIASFSLRTYSMSKWGSPLHYDALSLKGSQLIVTRPHFENELNFQAEQAVFDFAFDWRKRALRINIEIAEPHWVLQKPPTLEWKDWEGVLAQEESWFKTDPRLHLSSAELTWRDEDSHELHHMHFDLEADSQTGALIKLSFDPQKEDSNHLELRTASTTKSMELNCSFVKADCRSLIALADFFGFSLPQWRFTSGTLQGEIKAVFPNMRRPYLEGELLISQFAFNQVGIPLHGGVEQARLKLEKNQAAYDQNSQVSTIIGELEILKPAFIHNRTPDHQWSMKGIKGSVKLNGIETALIQLAAQVDKPGHFSNWTLEGKVNLNSQRSLNLDLALLCTSLDHLEGKIQINLSQPDEESKRAHIQIKTLSSAELDFMQTLLATFWPRFREVELTGGEFDALLEADVTSRGIGEIRLKQFLASRFRSKIKPWDAQCDFDMVRGYGKAHLGREDFWGSIQAGLHLENGSLNFEGITPQLPVTDIQGHLLIQGGQIDNSLVTLQIAGLKGKMDVEWGDNKQLLTFKLDGTVQDLAELFPHALQEGLKQHFYDNRLMVLANIKHLNQQFELGGTLHIQEALGHRMDTIHFGCELKREKGDPSSKFVPLGWFHASKLPVEKYLSPFIFREGVLHMEGDGEFKGSFDDQMLTIKYDADDLKIENENLLLEINHLHSPTPGQLVGSHQFDFNTFYHCGTLPIQNATYYEKNSGLLFQDLQGVAELKPSLIHIHPLEGSCEGIYFSGELELDYADPAPGVFDLKVHCPVLLGKVSQIQNLLAHLEPSSLLHQIPLEGEVSAKGDGLMLDFAFIPEDYRLNGDIQGTITEGSIPFEEADMALRGIYMDVGYSHQEKQLEFSDIQGTFIVGKPLRAQEYLFSGRHIRIHQLLDPDIDVDIAIKDQEDEIFRLSARTKHEENGIKRVSVDPLATHISCIYPQTWNCRLFDWSRIEEFEFSSQFDLNAFLQDLSRFRKSGLFLLSHCMIDKLAHLLPVQGAGKISLQAQSDQNYSFQVEGKGIKQGKSAEHYALLKGSKQDKKWIIDQLQWDDWNAYAELQQTDERWKIPFLGLSIGQNVLLGLEGDFVPNEGLLYATLNFCEMDIAKLDRWNVLKPFSAKWHPKGKVKASGEMEWSCLLSDPMEGFKASLTAETTDLSFRNYPLQVLQPFQIDINGDKGFVIRGTQIEIPPSYGRAAVNLEKLEYQPIQEVLGVLQLSFDIPSQEIAAVGESLHYHFPDMVDDSLKDLLAAAHSDGPFKGHITIENRTPDGHLLHLKMEDGIYGFKKRKWDLKHFEMQIAGGQLNFSAFTRHERCPVQIFGWMNWPDCSLGQTTLIADEQDNLLIKWKNEPESGYAIKSIQGKFSGCQLDLSEDREPMQADQWKALIGRVSLDFNRLCPLLPLQVSENIQKLKIGSSYDLMGRFWGDPELGETLLETAYFKGSLMSREAILKAYQVQTVEAEVQYVPGRLDIQNLTLQDPAGTVKVPSVIAMLEPEKQNWSLHVPNVSVKNLRISLLRDTEGSKFSNRSKFRSLVIKRIDLRDFYGDLDRQETWQARGNFHFTNPARKNIFSPLFAIPGEIILRLGLDPNVLNPVTGTVFFNLRGDRFYFTKMKDVFSEGRGSKFYLANNGTNPSWMDFDGNLSVQFRMKQYNLIFKLAELFTVSVEGNIRKPRYTLHKQPKSSHRSPSLRSSS